MKIALLVNELNIRGGTHKQVHRLAEYLIGQGHDVGIYTKYFAPERCYPGIENFRVFAATSRKEPPASRLLRFIFHRIADFILAIRVAREAEVVNIHDNGFLVFSLLFRLLARSRR